MNDRINTPLIRAANAADWPAIRAIYLEGIATGTATFETVAPEYASWDAGHLAAPRLVACLDTQVAGFAILSPVSRRSVYRGVAEVTIYVSAQARGLGIGKLLLLQLINDSEAGGLWTLQSSIFRLNHASIALHSVCGFRMVGFRERIAQRDGVWHDTVLMERRSSVVPAD